MITPEERDYLDLGVDAMRSVNNIDHKSGNNSNYVSSTTRTTVTHNEKNVECLFATCPSTLNCYMPSQP